MNRDAIEFELKKAGSFFRRQHWKEIMIFLLFVLLAFGFWFLQSLQYNYERKIELQIRYKNIPEEWILSENNPQTVKLALKDKGTSLLYYSNKANFTPVEISVKNLPRLTDSSLFISNRMLETELSKQLISSTSIVSIEPNEINLRFDSLSSLMATVTANIKLNTVAGFRLSDTITITPDRVKLYGNAKTLDQYKKIATKEVVLNNVSGTRELTAALDLPTGIKAEVEKVVLKIPIEEFAEKKLQIPVLCKDLPANYTLRIFPSIVEVRFNLPLSHFKNVDTNDLNINIPFRDFKANQKTGKLTLHLTGQPAWVTDVEIVPNEVEFIIEHD